MRQIRIENYPNFYYMAEDNDIVLDYLTDGVLDLKSKEFAPLKKSPVKDFTLMIRVSKKIGARQKFKKKKLVFTSEDGFTILQVLKKHIDDTEELLSQIKTDAENQALEDDRKARQAVIDAEESVNRTLNNVWDEFYKLKTNGAGKKWRESTAKNYKSFYSKWIRDTDLGHTPVKEIKKQACKDLINEISELRAMRTATTAIDVLRPMLEWYFDENEIDKRNPVPLKKDYPYENERVIDIELKDIRALYKAMDKHEHSDLFMWLRTGRRRGEIAGLTVEHIDLEGKSFLITAETNKAKVDMEYVLRPEMEGTIKTDEGKVFNITKDTISKRFTQMLGDVEGTFKLNGKRVKISELHLHDLRHIITGVLDSAEVPEEVRGKVLGHKRSGITNRYGKKYFGDIDKAYQLFLDIVYGVVPEHTKWG